MDYVIVSALAHPSIGGVETFTDEIAHHLVAAGHGVTVVTSRISADPVREEHDGIRILRLSATLLMSGRFPLPRPDAASRAIWAELAQVPCDGVLVNTRFYPLSLIGARFARRRGLTPLVLEHGAAHLTLGNRALDAAAQGYEHAITALIKRTRPRFYAVSQQGLTWLKHFGIEGAGVLPNAIDAAAFRAQTSARSFRAAYGIAPETMAVAFVGRLVPEKGIVPLVSAMGKLAAAHVPVELLVAGDGPLRSQLARALPANVHLLGALDAPDVAALLTEADLYCLPSRSEGFAISLLEAATCGTPSLVTDVGIARDLAPDERFGTILPAAEPDAIATALAALAAHPERLRAQGAAVRERVEARYSWEATTRLLIDAFAAAREHDARRAGDGGATPAHPA